MDAPGSYSPFSSLRALPGRVSTVTGCRLTQPWTRVISVQFGGPAAAQSGTAQETRLGSHDEYPLLSVLMLDWSRLLGKQRFVLFFLRERSFK